MTTVRTLRKNPSRWASAAGKLRLAMLTLLVPTLLLSVETASAQQDSTHWLHNRALPPGAIGSQRLLRGGPLLGYNQPVQLKGPKGVTLSFSSGGGFSTPYNEQLTTSLQIGSIYRFRATDIAGYPGIEVYPTIELVDRLYPPAGKENQFPIMIELTLDDLQLAAEGALVTRIVYVEDPKTAMPIEQKEEQLWFEAKATDDPLVLADELGRPVAIVRIGSRDSGVANYQSRFADPIELVDHTVNSHR